MLAGYDHLLAAGRRLQWDEAALDLAADRPAADALGAGDRGRLRRLVAGFCVAEAAVAEHLAPYVDAAAPGVARACFALQAADEARHARFFARAAREVLDLDPGAEARGLAGPGLRELFEVRLPGAAAALRERADALPAAVGLYHLVLEGVVFAVGQQALLDLIDEAGGLPALRAGVARTQADERWHVGLGVLALHDVAAPPEVEDEVALALGAWGPEVATPERTAHALRAHRRRTALLLRAHAA